MLETKEKVKEYIASLGNSEEITILDLRIKGITELDEDTFKGMTNLKRLNLMGNQLETLPSELFQGLTNLKSLNLMGNQLETLPSELFQGLTNLKWLWLSGNQLETLPSELFQGLTNLKTLYLYRNQLTTLPSELFQGLTNLEDLHLGRNKLNTLPSGLFNGLTNLEDLNLCENKFTTLPSELLERKEIIWNFDDLEKEMEENRKILEEQWKEHKKKFKFVMGEIDSTPPNSKYYSHLPCFSSFVGVEFYRGLEMLEEEVSY